jgi:hypothetical protein
MRRKLMAESSPTRVNLVVQHVAHCSIPHAAAAARWPVEDVGTNGQVVKED